MDAPVEANGYVYPPVPQTSATINYPQRIVLAEGREQAIEAGLPPPPVTAATLRAALSPEEKEEQTRKEMKETRAAALHAQGVDVPFVDVGGVLTKAKATGVIVDPVDRPRPKLEIEIDQSDLLKKLENLTALVEQLLVERAGGGKSAGEQIEELHGLLQRDVISAAEFEQGKKRALGLAAAVP
ncbi:hypothetical protein TeGR_g14908 [Tetraparma gracilis]|uniref:Uncharacterized protein n=1 Tax=Tetraparma gracilis TaxID=2962635 RepID=A0ABQ6M463_9STRA|nr:hypothetical protein TeGR_g14908 [Tetraparma gracilis]